MSLSSTERARLRKQRLRAGLRRLDLWLTAENVAALRWYGLLTEDDGVDTAVEALLRGLRDRSVALSLNWAMTDALVRGDRERGARMVACLNDRELLHSGRYSAFGRPVTRA